MADWFYAQGTMQRGPVALSFLTDALKSGTLHANDLVWRDGMAQWTPAGQVPELAGATGASPRPAPPAQPIGYTSPAAFHSNVAPAFGQPYMPAAPSQHASLATTSMVLGILGVCCFGFFAAIPALICGFIALNGMKRTGDARGKGMAVTGVVLGSVSIALSVLFLVLFLAIGVGTRHAPSQFYITPSAPRQWQPTP